MNEKVFIIVDLEATCVADKNPLFRNEIIEIGAVKVDRQGNILSEFQYFVQPIMNRTLTDFCKKLTTIQQEDINDAVLFPEALNDFLLWASDESMIFDDVVFASWGFYDKAQFISDCSLHNLPFDWIKNHISLKHQHGQMIGVPRGLGMKQALNYLNIPLEGTHHRAIYDAVNISKIFIKLINYWRY